MQSIFISHAWSEHERYQSFVGLIDELLGEDSWRNVSISFDSALNLSKAGLIKSAHTCCIDEITQLRARLSSPNLPESLVRISWDAQGNRREVEGRRSIERKLLDALVRKEKLEDENEELLKDDDAQSRFHRMEKGVALQIELHPNISLTIRDGIKSANQVFVLVTSMCKFRKWIDYEIATARELRVPVIAVMAGGIQTSDLSIDCSKVIPWNPDTIRRALERGQRF
jgi:hypothetical protein